MVSNLEKIKKSSDYTRLKLKGKRFSNSRFVIVNYLIIPESVTRYGVTVTSKVGPAHLRNRLKRWCREYMRLHEKTQALQRNIEINFIFKIVSGDFYSKLDFATFSRELDYVLERIRRSS